MGKVMDRLITNRLVEYLELHGKLSSSQYGFRRNKSTTEALINIIRVARENRARKLHTCLIMLDIKNAFNTVRRFRIREELEKMEVEPYLKDIIMNYLNDRTVLQKDGTDWVYNIGVPQGSSIGPILWLLIINELLERGNNNKEVQIQAFADDIAIMMGSPVMYKFQELAEEPLKWCADWANKNRLRFSVEKSQYMIIPWRGEVTRRPTLKFMGENIKNHREVRYLGVILDEKLSFNAHIIDVRERTYKFIYKINRITKKTWGLKAENVKVIYNRVIEKILLYGIQAWYLDKETVNIKLRQLQRPFLHIITKCYKTVATEAMAILAGCMPLDLRAKMECAMYSVYNEGKEVKLADRCYNLENCEKKPRGIREVKKLRSYGWTYSETPVTNNIYYTDGSKMDGRVGAASVRYEGVIKKEIRKIRLPNEASSYGAEVAALRLTIEDAEEKGLREIDLFTDSRSALQALQALSYKGETVEELKNYIERSGIEIHLHWVRAHQGTLGNEAADVAAKEATELDTIEGYYKYTREQLRAKIGKHFEKEWQERWNNSHLGRAVHRVYPVVSLKRTSSDFWINQAITQHGSIGAYQSRFFGRSNICTCGGIQTIEHCLFECANWDSGRRNLPREVRNWPHNRFFTDYYCRRYVTGIMKDLMNQHFPLLGLSSTSN